MKRLLHIGLLATLMVQVAHGGELRGAARVLDGDSLRIDRTEIRLHGIDAPEFKQRCGSQKAIWPCGKMAKLALIEMLAHETTRCVWSERDSYARALATCFVRGDNINAKMVATGMALAYRRYSDRYVEFEQRARNANRGLWRDEFQAPWLWRREHARKRKQSR